MKNDNRTVAKKELDEKKHLLEFAKNIKKGKAQEAMKNLKMAVAIKQQKRLNAITESGENAEFVLWGTKKGDPDYAETIITTVGTRDVKNMGKIDKAKKWATENGFDRLRVAKLNLDEKPDFGS